MRLISSMQIELLCSSNGSGQKRSPPIRQSGGKHANGTCRQIATETVICVINRSSTIDSPLRSVYVECAKWPQWRWQNKNRRRYVCVCVCFGTKFHDPRPESLACAGTCPFRLLFSYCVLLLFSFFVLLFLCICSIKFSLFCSICLRWAFLLWIQALKMGYAPTILRVSKHKLRDKLDVAICYQTRQRSQCQPRKQSKWKQTHRNEHSRKSFHTNSTWQNWCFL